MVYLIKHRLFIRTILLIMLLFFSFLSLKYVQEIYFKCQNIYPNSNIILDIFILTLLSAFVFLFIFGIYQKSISNRQIQKVKSLIAKDEIILKKLEINPLVKFFVFLIPGTFCGFFVLPTFIFNCLSGISLILKLSIFILFVYISKSCIDLSTKRTILTDKRILSLSALFNTNIEEFYYSEIKSIVYDTFLFIKEIRAVISEESYIYILNFKEMSEINSILNRSVNSYK